MDKSPNKSFFKKSFSFQTNRWEEWHQGKCLSSGEINLKIKAIDQKDTILFNIEGELDQLRIERISTFSYAISTITEMSFPYAGVIPEHPGVPGRISYNRELNLSSENDPTIVELHFENQTLACIRFCFNSSSLDIRIIEFYGEVISDTTDDTAHSVKIITETNSNREPINSPMQTINHKTNDTENKYIPPKHRSYLEGRARRLEIFVFLLFCLVAPFIAALLGMVIMVGSSFFTWPLLIILPTYLILILVRRMHDVGKPWWYLLIPGYNIVLCLWPGDKGDNEWGPDPREEEKKNARR